MYIYDNYKDIYKRIYMITIRTLTKPLVRESNRRANRWR